MITITPDQILAEAKKYLNVPFCHRGRSSLGLDCLGLIILSFKRLGINIPSDDGFGYDPIWWRRKEERLHLHFLKYDFEEVVNPQRGDIVTFRLFGKKYPGHHCGFIISNDTIIHTRGHGDSRERITKIETMDDSFKRRLGSYFRYKGYV